MLFVTADTFDAITKTIRIHFAIVVVLVLINLQLLG